MDSDCGQTGIPSITVNAPKNSIIIFTKAPLKGKVKTRLAKVIGDDAALGLYKNFVVDLLDTLRETDAYALRIGFYPAEREQMMRDWLISGLDYFPQCGADIGERMVNAFIDTFGKDIRKAVLIGTDFPDLPKSIIDQAFQALSDHDAVIGPTHDGGYYLIGFKAMTFTAAPFQGISWSTARVFEQTMAQFKSRQHRVYRLPPWQDIDLFEDLKALARRVTGTEHAPRTQSFLSKIPLSDLNPKDK